MKRIFTFLFPVFLFLVTNVFAQSRGTIVDAIPMVQLSPQEIMLNLQANMDEINYGLIDAFTYKKYDVNAIKIVYNTIDGQGNPTTASGVVFLPLVTTPTEMPVFSYLHGTLTKYQDIPSNLGGIESIIGWIMAMDGYIAVLPDYIGLGIFSPGIHPFTHAATEASASIDMLIAAKFLLSDPLVLNIPDGNLYLSGYSQGAHAALATQREFEKNPIPDLELRKTVAGSGAYSMSYIQKRFLFAHPEYPNPSFLPYLILGYQQVYGNLYSSLDQVFVSPYNDEMPGYFNGLFTVEDIDGFLPDTWQTMFVPRYLRDIKYRYFHPVNIALRKNDLIDWKPQNDLHLYYCNCDEIVAKENSWLAYLSFLLKGSRNVTCLPLGNLSHNDCAPPVMLLTKIQFDCESGINPCGFYLIELLKINKSTEESDLSMLKTALDPNATIDKKLLTGNIEVNDYLFDSQEELSVITVYPNPASEIVYIELPADDIYNAVKLNIYDIQGRLIRNELFNGNNIELDVKSMQPGVYKLVVNSNKSYIKTLVVKR